MRRSIYRTNEKKDIIIPNQQYINQHKNCQNPLNSHCNNQNVNNQILHELNNLCLIPPDNACEERREKHNFKVVLGECKVVRDVNVTHCIVANLEHHIKEDIICQHKTYTKQTTEHKKTEKCGSHCNEKFPNNCEIVDSDCSDVCNQNKCDKDDWDDLSKQQKHCRKLKYVDKHKTHHKTKHHKSKNCCKKNKNDDSSF